MPEAAAVPAAAREGRPGPRRGRAARGGGQQGPALGRPRHPRPLHTRAPAAVLSAQSDVDI